MYVLGVYKMNGVTYVTYNRGRCFFSFNLSVHCMKGNMAASYSSNFIVIKRLYRCYFLSEKCKIFSMYSGNHILYFKQNLSTG